MFVGNVNVSVMMDAVLAGTNRLGLNFDVPVHTVTLLPYFNSKKNTPVFVSRCYADIFSNSG
jgi:hypothetical protein